MIRLPLLSTLLLAALLPACFAEEDPGCGVPVTTADPPAGLYPENATVTITLRADRPATIYFTLDGTPPRIDTADCVNGPTFCGTSPVSNIPIAFDGMPLQYFAVDHCGNQEAPKASIYRLDRAPETVADPPPGLYNRPIDVRLTASDEATEPPTIYWTTDGSEPSPAGIGTQSGPSPVVVSLQNSTTLKWAAEDVSGNREPTRTGQYTIDTIPPTCEAVPDSGFFEDAVDVQLRISNDTGSLYYSTNGAVPDPAGDANGHTKVASLQTTLTFNESTILRFTCVDKAGNPAHDAGEFAEEVYIIDDLPAVVATPPGGSYDDSTLTVTLTGAPESDTNLYYAINGGAEQTYTGPFQISGSEGESITVAIRAQREGQTLSVTRTEVYELGVATQTATFSEDFADTAFIDMARTTAKIDTEAQKAVLPDLALAETTTRTHTVAAAQIPRTLPWSAQVAVDENIKSGVAAVIDGTNPGVGGSTDESGAGLKLYTFAGDGSNLDWVAGYFVGAPAGAQPSQVLAAEWLRATPVGPPLLAALSIYDGLLLFDLTNVPSGVMTPLTTYTGDAFYRLFGPRVAMAAQRNQLQNMLYATGRPSGGGNTVLALQIDPLSPAVTRAGQVTLTTGTGSEVIGLVLDPQDTTERTLLALTVDCELYRVDFTSLASPTTALVNAAACAGTANQMKLVTVQFQPYVLISYLTSGGVVEVDVLTPPNYGLSTKGVLDEQNRPAGGGWSMDVAQAGGPARLLLSGGAQGSGDEGLYIYDMSNPAATTWPLVTKVAAPDGFAIDGVAHAPNGAKDTIFATLRDATPLDLRGGIKAWSLSGSATSAIVQSTNINTTGSRVRSVKLESADPANATVRFSTDGTNFDIGPLAVGNVETIDPAADALYWQTTLTDPTLTELRNVTIRLGLE